MKMVLLSEMSHQTGISRWSLLADVKHGILPALKAGGRFYVREDAIDTYLAEAATRAKADAASLLIVSRLTPSGGPASENTPTHEET